MLSRLLKYLQALLGLLLVVDVSVFPDQSALWIAFGAAIALIVVAAADGAWAAARRRVLTPALAAGIVLLSGFLLAATFDFRHASLTWLIAIAGAAIEGSALTAIGIPRLRIRAIAEAGEEPPAEQAPRLAA